MISNFTGGVWEKHQLEAMVYFFFTLLVYFSVKTTEEIGRPYATLMS